MERGDVAGADRRLLVVHPAVTGVEAPLGPVGGAGTRMREKSHRENESCGASNHGSSRRVVFPAPASPVRGTRQASSSLSGSWDDVGARLAGEGEADVGRVGDDRLAAASLQKVDHRLDLREHAPRLEMALGHVAPRISDGHPVDVPLVRRPEVQANRRDARRNDEQLGSQLARQEARRMVLVDDRGRAPDHPRGVLDDGDPSSARRDDHEAGVEQTFHRAELKDRGRRRRGDDAPPSPSSVLDQVPPVRGAVELRLLLGQERPDGLVWFRERGIGAVHETERDHRGRGFLDAEAPELVEERELDVVAERPLRVRHAGVERHRVELFRRELGPAQDEPDLRAVSVRDHEPEARVPEERRDVAARFGARLVLVRDALVLLVRDERVPADRDDGRLDHVSHYTFAVSSRPAARIESPFFVDKRRWGSWVRAICSGFALLGLSSGAVRAQSVTEFNITGGATPTSITTGPDGNLWFAEEIANRVGRITPLGAVTEFGAGTSAFAFPTGITAGPDGNLWFTESGANQIGRITPLGVVTEFSAGITPFAQPVDIAAGSDGNLWFTEPAANRIGRITPLGAVTEFSGGITPLAQPANITAGPDGNLWFTESGANQIGRITPLGVVPEFSAGITPLAQPAGITAGPDGNLWFTEIGGNRIGRITPLGVVTEFSAGITPLAQPLGITAGPDGNLWFTEAGANQIGRITPLGVVTEFVAFATGPAFLLAEVAAITSGPDGNVWFTAISSNGTLGDRIARITTGPVSATSFHPTAPCRVLDTRSPPSALGGPALAAGAKRDFVVTGTCGIPAAAVSISANVTIAEPTAAATLFTLPARFPVLAFQAGTTRANNALLVLAPDGSGTLSFSNDLPSGTVQLIVDVNGWWQ